MAEVTLPLGQIQDWADFHAASAAAFGFPDFYGCNGNASIDCLSNLAENDGMSAFILTRDEQLVIHLPDHEQFAQRAPDIAACLLEWVAAINSRYIDRGETPRLALVPA
jgi:hypothetical protein